MLGSYAHPYPQGHGIHREQDPDTGSYAHPYPQSGGIHYEQDPIADAGSYAHPYPQSLGIHHELDPDLEIATKLAYVNSLHLFSFLFAGNE